MKKIVLLAILCLAACAPNDYNPNLKLERVKTGLSYPVKAMNFKYNNHDYIYFHGVDRNFTIVHDPDCLYCKTGMF